MSFAQTNDAPVTTDAPLSAAKPVGSGFGGHSVAAGGRGQTGRLSARAGLDHRGLLHDLNNMLFAVRGYAELAVSTERWPECVLYMSGALDALEHATTLVEQIRSPIPPIQPAPVDVRMALTEAEKMLVPQVPANVALRVEPPAEPMTVGGGAGLTRMLINLGTNALHAVARGGAVTMTARLAVTQQPAGSFVRFRVEDTGCGMDSQTRERMFEPLFTTRTKAEGQGLGMSIVQEIVDDLDGFIAVDTKIGTGTRIDVYLPLNQRDAHATE